MKIMINKSYISIRTDSFELRKICARWKVNGKEYNIFEGTKSVGGFENLFVLETEIDGVTAKWSIRSFNNAVRIRLEIKAGRHDEITEIVPLCADIRDTGNLKVLSVPFDNDDWVRYRTAGLSEKTRSYGVGAVFDNDHALSLGVVDHSFWKTGIDFNAGNITVTAGIADPLTRDACPHGAAAGAASAPELWIFEADSWQSAMEAFAAKYSELHEPLRWSGSAPRGWNSWYAYTTDIDAEKYENAVRFISEIKAMKNGYVNFDAFWTRLSADELKNSVRLAEAAGLKPGIYLAPFATWIEDDRLDMPVTDDMGNVLKENVTWRDILLKDRAGEILPRVDGGYSIDMTHPVAVERMETALRYLKELGYKYIKLDFLGHAAREGAFYDKSVRTGMQCYDRSMRKILSVWNGDDMFISLSIAPVFPGGFGHARRVCCDVFGEMKDSRYLLNSLTYGWWLNKYVYEFNDPDHICFDKGDKAAKFRFISGLIGGTVFLVSIKTEEKESAERVKSMTANTKLMGLIDHHITFVPDSRYIEDDTAMLFRGEHDGKIYYAVFNFGDAVKEFDLNTGGRTEAAALYSGRALKGNNGAVRFALPPADCEIIMI